MTDALGRQTDLIEYKTGEPTDYVNDPPSDYADIKYTYDPSGAKATETDAAGNQWSWSYDLLGDQTDAYDPDAGHTVDSFDNAGQILTSTDGRGKQTTFVYDNDGRKTFEYDTTATQVLSSANEVASWVYDTLKKGYPTSSTSYSNGDTYTSATLAYNAMGLVSATKYTLTGTDAALVPAAGYTVSYGYTFTGLPSVVSDPAMGGLPSETVTTSYDNYAHPIKLAGSGGVTWTYVSLVNYDNYDHPTLYTMPTVSGTVQAGLTYDPQTNAVTGVKTTDSTNTNPVDQLTYTYGNASGTVSKGSGLLTETVDSQSGGSTVDTQCFTYDYAQRIAQAWTATDNCAATPAVGSSATVGGADAPYWQSWTYDAAGDRATEVDHDTTGNSANDTATTYNYPTPGSSTDQPTTLSSTSATGPGAGADSAVYQYDSAGNEISVTGGALGNQGYSWNDQDQLQSTSSAAGTTYYVYDASGNQLLVRDPSSTTLTLGDAELNLVSGSGNVTGTRFYSIGGATLAERTSAGVLSILIPDRQGTDQLAVATTAAQTVTRRQYLPFGQTRGTSSPWVGGDDGYVGGQADAATGLETLGARVYDPVDGRFLSVDPVFEGNDPTQLAGYDYAGNDPVTGSDPGGMDAGEYGTGVGGSAPDCDKSCIDQEVIPELEQQKKDAAAAAKREAQGLKIEAQYRCAGISTDPDCGTPSWYEKYDIWYEYEKQLNFIAGEMKAVDDYLWPGLAGCISNGDSGDCVPAAVYGLGLAAGGGDGDAPGCGGDSFTADTEVLTSSGKTVPIDSLKIGDKVVSADTATGKNRDETVQAVLVHHDTDLYDLKVATGQGTDVIHTTADHRIWDVTQHVWVEAAKIHRGDRLLTPDGASVEAVGGTVPADADGWMWDLTVANLHAFYVEVNGAAVLVHNDGGGWSVGQMREMYVAELTGGYVAVDPKGQDIPFKTAFGSSGLDVVGPNGELVFVGGANKANNLAKFGEKLKASKVYADQQGVTAQYYLDDDTPDAAVKLAERYFGANNVHMFSIPDDWEPKAETIPEPWRSQAPGGCGG